MMRIARPISGMTPAYSGSGRDARPKACAGHIHLSRGTACGRCLRRPRQPADRLVGMGLTRNRSLVRGAARNMRRSPIGTLPGRR